jgi:multimeric flavodoxin WrbA
MLGAGEAGNQIEKIFLREKKIGYCTGCGSCYTIRVFSRMTWLKFWRK